MVDSGTIGDLAFSRSASPVALTKWLVRAASMGAMLNACQFGFGANLDRFCQVVSVSPV